MTGPDFEYFSRRVHELSGLILTPEKAYLITSRLDPIARGEGLAGAPQLLTKLRTTPNEVLLRRCVNAMATHESSFFRDGGPFEQFAATVLPPLLASRQDQRKLRIWCAACSSGQEPYSLAIILSEMSARLSGWKIEILATDMSETILQKARAGLYSDFEVKRGLTPERIARWFKKDGLAWRISPTLQQMVKFQPHNLLQGAGGLGVFDVILCRNVLIYFDLAGKRQVLGELSKALAPDGALFLGSAETVLGVSDAFQSTPGSRGLYRRTSTKEARSA